MKHFSDVGNEIEMINWFDKFVESGLNVDTYCFNILISFYGRSKNEAKALEWFSLLQSKGLEPDVATFNSIMSMYRNNPQKVEEWKAKMIESGLQPTEFTYNILISSIIPQNDFKGLFEILSEMESRNVPTTLALYKLLIPFCIRHQKVNKSISIIPCN